jgi:hypothetical protein
MKIKGSHVLGAILLLAVGILWIKGFWFTEVFRTHKSNEPHRTALLQIQDSIALGALHADVLAAYWEHRTDSLRLFADRSTDWVITMPLEFGATNWKLLIDFLDGRVSALRIRTSDGPPPNDPSVTRPPTTQPP